MGFGPVTCAQHPGDAEQRSTGEIYAQAIELARHAEVAGLSSFWVSEHHLFEDGYLPSPLLLLSSVAAVTERIDVGTAVLVAPFQHPLRLAEDAAVLDIVSRGRLQLGLGLGYRADEYEAFGADRARRGAKFDAALATLRRAWSEDDRRVFPKPLTSGGPQVWIGGTPAVAVPRAERHDCGYLASVYDGDGRSDGRPHSGGGSAITRAELGAWLDAKPHPEVPISVIVRAFIWDGPGDPWSALGDIPFHNTRWLDGRLALFPDPSLSTPRPSGAEARAQFEDIAIIGGSDEVAGRLAAYRPLVGERGHLIVCAYYPGLPWEVQVEQVRALGRISGGDRWH